MLGDARPGRGTTAWARLRTVRSRIDLGIARDWADRQPKRVGLTFALIVGAAITAAIGGLAYLTSSSAGASDHSKVAADRAERAARQAQAAFGPIRLGSVTPTSGSVGVTGATTVQITLSTPI